MIKVEATTLEEAYIKASTSLGCSVVDLKIEVVQAPSKGLFGLFSKPAIVVAVKNENIKEFQTKKQEPKKETLPQEKSSEITSEHNLKVKKKTLKKKITKTSKKQKVFNDTIMPESFVSMQDDEDYGDIDSEDYEDVTLQKQQKQQNNALDMDSIVAEVDKGLNNLFNFTCFSIDRVEVSAYDTTTLLVEFKGADAALLIGKEGYRYKALSYMIFNWVNTKYQVQLRLEIAEFLKNQEESVSRYLEGVRAGIQRDGRAQTKILDGVLVQIALKELRASYSDKYVAIRTTRDGLKYIIVNDYHNN